MIHRNFNRAPRRGITIYRFFPRNDAEGLTPLEAKTIVREMTKESTLVLINDPSQTDASYVDRLNIGSIYPRDCLRDQPCRAHVPMECGERSQLAETAPRKV